MALDGPDGAMHGPTARHRRLENRLRKTAVAAINAQAEIAKPKPTTPVAPAPAATISIDWGAEAVLVGSDVEAEKPWVVLVGAKITEPREAGLSSAGALSLAT